MKQRLLLVLLALFTSIGWMNADVVLTIDKGTKGSLSFTKASGKTDAIKINNDEQTGTSFTLKGDENFPSIIIEGPLATLNVNLKVTGVTVTDASDLTSLTFSSTAGSVINSFTFDNTEGKLATLTADNCGLISLPTNLKSALADKATVSLKNNKLKSISASDLKDAKDITYNFDGNEITSWEKLTNASITYGSQSSAEIKPITAPVANDWFDVWTAVSTQYDNTKVTAASQLNYAWRKGTSGSFSETLIKKSDTYAGNFQFYSSNEYQSGTYQCQVSPKTAGNGPTYVVTVDVKAAQFTLKIETEPTEGGSLQIANTSGTITSENTPITKGEQLVFSATKNTGYTFSEYEVVGLSKVSDNVYKVDGHGEDKVLSAKAIFKKNTYKITVDASTEHGSYVITNTTDNSEVTNGKAVSHNDKLTIKATPEEGYTPRVIVNQEEKNYKTDDPQNGVYTFENIAITKNSTIQILFDKTEVYTLKVQYVTGYTLKVNGKEYDSSTENTQDEEKGYYKDDNNQLNFPAGTLINLEMTKGTKKIKKILLNGAFVSSSSTAQFEMPTGSKDASDPKSAFVTFETADLATITITGKNLETDNETQKYTYDGNAHAFQYTVTPTGLTGFTVKYSNSNFSVPNYQATEPTAVGTYDVQITRNADANYAKYDSQDKGDKMNFKIQIVKATPTITTAPTVTVTTDGDYSISGGVAQVGGKTVAGEWTVVDINNTAITKPIDANKGKSHLATVAFLPTDKSNLNGSKTDGTVSDAAQVQVAVKVGDDDALSTYKVTATNIPSDMSLTFWNGSNEVKSGSSLPKGTNLTIKLTYPAGYTKVLIQENKSGGLESEEGKDGEIEWNYNTNSTTKKGLEAALDVTVTYEGSASVYTPVIEIQNKVSGIPYDYTGEVGIDKLYTTSNFKFKTYSINAGDNNDLINNMTITYKDASGNAVVAPINAGEYTVVVSIPALELANGTYKAVTQEFEALYVINKKEVTVTEWPSGAVVGVGKDATTAQFIGGAADVEGTFHFIEEDKIGIPETGDAYFVKFVPKDSNNYKEVFMTNNATKVKIVVTDQRTLFISDVANGTIKVTDQNGNELKDEQILDSKITSIKVEATPNSGYVLNTLTVNNTSIASGSTYTLGSDNVVVTATFIKQHTITLGSAPKGVKIATKPSSNIVNDGGSYTFTLNHVSGDKPTVTGTSNISVSTSGSTTTVKVTNIKANATLTIALANPTAIKITTKETLSKAGKPMGTIRVSGVNSSNECYYGDKVTVTATANAGVEFSGWEDLTSTENPYEFEATNATYTFQAKYHGTLTGIESVDELNYYGGDGYIFINCPAQGTLTIISMNGRAQKMSVSGQTRVTVPAGVYGIVLTSGSEVVRDKVVVR